MTAFRKIRYLILIIIPAILWVGYNNVANRHHHLLEYGLVTTHAHNYEKAQAPDKVPFNHSHSKREYIYLNQVFDTLMVSLTIAGIAIIISQLSFFLPVSKKEQLIYSPSFSSIPGRGPPKVRYFSI